jgi:putative ABC transport system substrate-binding protein
VIDRRTFLAGTGAVLLAAPLAAEAQQAQKVWHIGYLGQNSQPEVQHLLDALRQGLRQRGLTEDRDVVIEYRFAQGKSERLVELAGELVQARVDVIVTSTDTLGLAAKQVTTTIPIVMVAAGDPLASGLAVSLAKPGGNVTGMSITAPDLAGKRLQLLREAVPRLSRVAVLWYADNPAKAREVEEAEVAARSLRMSVHSVPIRGSEPALSSAFAAMRNERVQAALVLGDAYSFRYREEIAARAMASRLPTMWEVNVFMDKGGLMSYGPDLVDNFRRAATYVDRIFKGAKPGDLPIEQPTKYELIINLKTAKALGLTIPPSLLGRADEIIQ